MSSRRSFVKQVSLATVLSQWSNSINALPYRSHSTDAIDWEAIRNLFPVIHWDKIHFNSGSSGVLPIPVLEYLNELTVALNSKAPYQTWSDWTEEYQSNKVRIAELVGSDTEEIQFVRNTTEALNLIIQGIPLQSGDEVLVSEHAYPYAANAWTNRAKRDALQIRKIKFSIPESDEHIVDAFVSRITDKTRVIHLTHITHRQGHVMPIKPIIEFAKSRNIEVVVDGAHVVAQIPVDVHDLGCDYYASSLHKWLNAPHGCGLLFAKEDKLQNLFPIISAPENESGINKFAHLGTRAWQIEVGLSASLDFHDRLGFDNKYRRLQELKKYWTSQLKDVPKIRWWSALDDEHSCSVICVGIEGVSGGQIKNTLDSEYNIHAKSVGGSWGSAIRISPNIFTSYDELDQLVHAMKTIAQES